MLAIIAMTMSILLFFQSFGSCVLYQLDYSFVQYQPDSFNLSLPLFCESSLRFTYWIDNGFRSDNCFVSHCM